MDPNATLEVMTDPTADADDRREARANLLEWIARGGFVPKGWNVNMIRGYRIPAR